ncbi:MAG: DUF368 domain-containing protein [Phycisphaerae bacterium]|nr:DUF368 domain-containing protein [Phycisphaerae bacterium]
MTKHSPTRATLIVPTNTPSTASPASFGLLRLARTALAGVLMGTANLIPGVSGGTMVLAMGLYQDFIDSVADLTAFRFSWRRIVFLGVLGAFAVAAIVLLAKLILFLLFHYSTAMFALFIGLTLGGAPTLVRSLRPVRFDVVIATAVGGLLMIAILLLKYRQGGGLPHNMMMDFISGVIGATTMVLPGVSGSYMLLVLDQYDRVVGSIDDRDLMIIVPVGLGAILGIIGLSNVLKLLLHRFARPTIGVLLGILLGSIIGLWPFGKEPGEKALERRSPAELRSFAEGRQLPGLPPPLDETASDADRLAALRSFAEKQQTPEILAALEAEGLKAADAERLALIHVIRKNWAQRGRSSYSADKVVIAILGVIVGFVVTFTLARGQPVPMKTPASAQLE